MSFDISEIELNKHQQEALDCVLEELQNENNRVLFSMCTGSGKTRVILKIPHEMEWERVIYIFPTLTLVSQFKNGSPLSLNPIKLGLATFYFVESLLNNNIFKHEGIERVSKIIRSLHAYELFYGDLEQLSSLKLPFFESKEVEQP